MPLIKKTTNVLTGDTVASGARSSAATTKIDGTQAVQLAITVDMIFDASATDGAVIEILSSEDDVLYDTEPFVSRGVTADPGNKVVVTIDVPASPKFFDVSVLNEDPGFTITALNIKGVAQNAT